MHLREERWDDVARLQIVGVAGSVEVGRLRRDEVACILPAVGGAKLQPGDLGDRVPLIGRLEGPVRRCSSFIGCGASRG